MVNFQNFPTLQGKDQLDFEWGILVIGCQRCKRTKKRAVGAQEFQAAGYETSLVFY